MPKAATLKSADPAGTSLILQVEANPLLVLTDQEQFDRFYDEVAAEVRAHEPDLSTLAGRKAIASLAYKVARTKTAIDDAGKLLTEEKRAEIKKVDEARKRIREKLDELKDEARKPLTEWETAEEARVARVTAVLDQLKAAAVILADDTSETLKARLATVEAITIEFDEFQDYEAAAKAQWDGATTALQAGIERLLQEEADRRDLERLRAEAAERAQREAAEREARERENAHSQALIDHIQGCAEGRIGPDPQPFGLLLRELSDKVVADEQCGARRDEVERLRLATIVDLTAQMERQAAERQAREAEEARQQEEQARADREAAAEQARAEAQRQAQAEAAAREQAHQQELAEAQRRATEAEAARQAEADRIAEAEAARQAEAERVAEEQRRREQNRAHRGRIMAAAKTALIEQTGIDEETAKKVVLAIASRSVPHVSIDF